jgi:hypothetical protein
MKLDKDELSTKIVELNWIHNIIVQKFLIGNFF